MNDLTISQKYRVYKIRLFLLFVVIFIASLAYGQQKPVFSQYMFNPMAINPAFAGTQEQLSLSALYRNQWVNLKGSPTVITFSGHTGMPSKNIGLGFVLSKDQVGIHSDVGLYLSYAYHLRLGKDRMLSLGLQGGFNNLISDFNLLELKDDNDPNLTGVYSKFNPNFGMGLFYMSKKFYAGLSIPYIVNTRFFREEDIVSDARAKRYYFLTAGYVIDLNSRLQFKPEFMIRIQEGSPFGYDLNGKFIIDRKVSLGVSYRSGDALIGTFEFQMNENFRIGYAYEYVISALNYFTLGSHEIMINYRTASLLKRKSKHCPTYF